MLTVNTGFCIFDLFLAAILVFGWAHTRPFFENSAEIERIIVSHSSSNFVDGFIGIIQIPFCCGNSQICNILHRRNLHDTFEAMNKPVRAHQVFFCSAAIMFLLTQLKVEKANAKILAEKHMTEDDVEPVYGNV